MSMAKKKPAPKRKPKKPVEAKAETPIAAETVVGRTYTPEQIKAVLSTAE